MQFLSTCTRPCLVPRLIPNRDRECDVVYSYPIKCTDQCDWLHVPFDLYKRANISKGDSFASHSLSPLKQNQIRHSPPLKKTNKSPKLHSLRFSGKLFSLTKKITTKFTIKISSFLLYSCLRDNKFTVIRLNKKLTNKVLLCNHRDLYFELNAPNKPDSRLRLIFSLKYAIASRLSKC